MSSGNSQKSSGAMCNAEGYEGHTLLEKLAKDPQKKATLISKLIFRYSNCFIAISFKSRAQTAFSPVFWVGKKGLV